MDIDVTLFPREAIELLGIAPLTSMFTFGPHDRQGVDDFRPQVHDSEKLQIWSGSGEWSWRPLVNPQEKLRLSLFGTTDPKGFGLMQRTRDFAEYQDLEARYDLRPSLWVEPLDAWGGGHIRLIEIQALREVDNIVAFWVPREPVQAGSEWRFRYRLYWCRETPFSRNWRRPPRRASAPPACRERARMASPGSSSSTSSAASLRTRRPKHLSTPWSRSRAAW